ncbi:MAG: ferrous iron transport protein B [Butyrivibrio sp.]|uniref:ferrous iron transport protein B n=1 Tax=Butyrivibrio sp. TaxID=28121 RepID=UPI0025EBE2DA|nr:ferrous iron transport protein B [Butyrivibrio sp.]MCR5770757.1 ferrous iron transport protein B [Butyrivibrio sp.]
MRLDELKIGEKARIDAVGGAGATRQHFLDMGVIPGANLEIIKYAPMGDPVEIRIHGYELTLRLDDARQIDITKISDIEEKEKEHHTKPSKNNKIELPKDRILKFALVGNQNSGKTTLFNRLTGSNQHVGNFPGVTVDRKDGSIIGYPNTVITDLPGIYSMSPYSSEELVSRNFVLHDKPDAIINIVDATNIERNLYLTMQLLEMDRPMVVALNMMDELTGNGGSINIKKMTEMLGVPVIPISAAKNSGVDELIHKALSVAKNNTLPKKQDFCLEDENGGAVHRCLHGVGHFIEDHAKSRDLPVRFVASKIIEGDKQIIRQLKLDKNEIETIEHITIQMERERNLDRSAAIADMRFAYIARVTKECVKKPHESKERIRSEKIDRILTGKYTAIPVFILIMSLVFYLTFNVIGAVLQEWLELGISSLSEVTEKLLISLHVNKVIQSLVIDGIFAGVGSVLSFLPIVVVMFFFLSLLEDSGYIARVAFFMDKLLRKIGLSGRSIVPLLIGFGCTVPAVMSTRTLPSERDRRMTILLTPFMSCTAKLPIYAFFVNAFFPKKGGIIMTGLYVCGIAVGIVMALIYRKFIFKGEAVPFVMELPNYRLPGLQSTFQLMWEKAKDFLQRAFTVIFLATIVVWFLQSFNFHFDLVTDSADSIIAFIAGLLAPVFAPLGLGDWRIVTALISGFMAKESVVSVMEVLFNSDGGVSSVLTPITAGVLLIFSLLYTPCVAAVASIKRELGAKWAIAVVIWQCVVAWIIAFIVKLILML